MLISQSKWPPQLRMPSRDIQVYPATPSGVSSILLKRHKTLPHPREGRISENYSITTASKPQVLSVDTGIPSSPTSQSSSPRTLKHASRRIGVPDLPPTPPTHSRQSSSGSALPENIRSHKDATKSPSLPTTPTNHQSPPTPDVTPPRGTARSVVSRPPITERNPSSGYPSSRNDSFKTAREDFSSEDEDEVSTVRPILPSARPSQVEIPTAKLTKSREIGLGLGLESDNERTPSPGYRKRDKNLSVANPADEFVTFDGQWSSTGEVSEVEREWDHNLMRNVTVRKRPARDSLLYNGCSSSEVLDDNPVTPTNATKLLRKYPILETLSTRSTAFELGQITPTHGVATDSESPTTLDIRRFSAMSARSGTSTVVEAMVVETPPQRRKTLRHTKKQLGLRELSSDHSTYSSAADSVFSSNPPHRLVHKSSGIFSRKQESLGSAFTNSTSSSAKSQRDIWTNGSIPVVVVPERHSSMKSARTPSLRSTSSKTKRSLSLSSAPLSQSANTNDPGYIDIPKRNPRRLLESGASSGSYSQRTIDFPPVVPIRRSSLSAPTSRNNSRAASLTAESLRAHNLIQAAAEQPDPSHIQFAVEPQKDSMHLAPRASVDQNGDPFFGNRLSTQVTPFSQASYETNGTAAEVAQATSVALYPHHNKSVLVVEQQAQSSTAPLQTSVDAVEQPEMAVDEANTQDPVTPPQQQRQEIDEVDSPLRNPRDAPQPPTGPPAIQFIPPTPNVLTPAQEENRELGQDVRQSTADQKPKRGFSLIRRALSNRRRSDSIITRTFSTKRNKGVTDEATQTSKEIANPTTLYPSVLDQPADGSKLHPFWRPARFWDDLEDDDELYIDRDAYPPVDNRPSLPKRSFSSSLKRTFAILPIRDDTEFTYWTERRVVQRTQSGNLRVVKNRGSSGSLRRAVSDGRAYYMSGNSRILPDSSERGKVWAGFKGIGRRVSERRRERRNEKLRKTISLPKDAVDGVARVIASDGMAGFTSNMNGNGTIRRKAVPLPQQGPEPNTAPISQE